MRRPVSANVHSTDECGDDPIVARSRSGWSAGYQNVDNVRGAKLRYVIKPPRPLDSVEIETLLALDVPAHLATIDRDGFPHITPIWFVWQDDAFYMTSIADRPHLKRLDSNARAGLGIDIEDRERADGQRSNRQVRAIGSAELFPDDGAVWTTRVTEKYARGPALPRSVAVRAADERIVIRLRPRRLVAVASV
jgi:nitroimidazol reductase NimA-like FMN-containing flavoprotein (pyridoxamine 5'-phosphate oxidase superfamily)